MDDTKNLLENELLFDGLTRSHLNETIKWGRFISILGYIYSAIILAGALFGGIIMSVFTRGGFRSENITANLAASIAYLVMGGVVLYMSNALFRFSNKTRAALKDNDQQLVSEAFGHLKVYFRLAGIVCILATVFSILALIGLLIASAFSRG